MSGKKRVSFNRCMIRPLIYKAFARLIYALTAALLWNRFSNISGLLPLSHAFSFFAVLFAVAAWLAHLRLDGVSIPKLPQKKPHRHDPLRTYADLSDHTDDDIVAFDDLDENEQNLCLFYADLVCCAVFLIISLF